MEGKTALLPGEAWWHARDTGKPGREAWLSDQESAEGIVPGTKSDAWSG